ncbi:PREDICTED: uncharacterized protein LOC109465311 [Branchiostoma belcheri]|uniref:Uncharacterized protein LOC109465311 n=1 Tax=Branchiostoma belcheri TaxID=7741 RepID=A0A6P4Y6T3_BRABE|nr:PREDICTED: uncharacterized protein LOC109465311 [Branchiostoma belcheri]
MKWSELLDSIEREVKEVFSNKRFKLDVLKENIHNGPSTLIDIKVTDKTSGKRLLIDCHQLKRKELRIQEVDFLANYASDEHCTHAALIASPDSDLTDQVQEHAVRVGVAMVRFQPSTFRRKIGQVFNNGMMLQQKMQHGDARNNDMSSNLKPTVRIYTQNEKNSGANTCVLRTIPCRNVNGRYHLKSEGVSSSKATPRDLVSGSWWLRKGTSTLWKTNTIQVQPSDVWQIHQVPADAQQLPENVWEDLSLQSQVITLHNSVPSAVQKQRYRNVLGCRDNSLWLFNTKLPQGLSHIFGVPTTPTIQPLRRPTAGIVQGDGYSTERQTTVGDGAFYSTSQRFFTATTSSSQPKEERPKDVTEDLTTSHTCTLIPNPTSRTLTETTRRNPTKLFDKTSQTPTSQETGRVTGVLQNQPQRNGTNGVSVVLGYPKVVKQHVLEPIVTVVGRVGEVAIVKTMSVALFQLKAIVDTLYPLVGVLPSHLVKTLAYSMHLVRVSTTLIRRTPQRPAKKPRRTKQAARRVTPQCAQGGRLLVQGWRPIVSQQNFRPIGNQRQQPIKMPGAATVCQIGRPQRIGAHAIAEQNGSESTQDGLRNESSEGDKNVLSESDNNLLHSQSAVAEVIPVKMEPSNEEQACNSSANHANDVESLSPVKSEHLEQHDLETSSKVASTETSSHDQGVPLTATTCKLESVEDSMVKKEDPREGSRDAGRGAGSSDDDSEDDVSDDVMPKPVVHGLFEPLKADSNVKSEAATDESHDPEHYVGINTGEHTLILSDESDEDNDMPFKEEPLGGEGLFVGNLASNKAESLDSGCVEEQGCLPSSRKSSSSSFYSFLSFFSFSSSASSCSSSSSDGAKIKKDDEKDTKDDIKTPKVETVDSEVDSLYNKDGPGSEEKGTPFDIGVTPSSRKFISRDFSWSSSTSSSSSDSVSFATPTRLSSGEISRVKYSNSPLNKYDGSPDMRVRVNRSSMLGSPDRSPRNANGTPDMRWTGNRESLCGKSPQGLPLNVNKSPDMRWKFNRAALLQKSPQGALLNVDGSPDRRFKVTRNLARKGQSNVSTRTLVFN